MSPPASSSPAWRWEDDAIVIEPASKPREGWGAAAPLVRERGEDGLLDEPTLTAFDDDEWTWG